ncbi:hypothetical protein [Novosphingobium terrae]|uniref:hypothetical protein n=1 Tax=Novosphingobium terrae TaxID=2726189 RepID=UPI00197F9293|nr:hypothetical protein [Novosphingobium terrae]
MAGVSIVMPVLCLAGVAAAGYLAEREWVTQTIILAMRDPLNEGQAVLADHADDPPEALGDRAKAGLAELALMSAGRAQSRGERLLDLVRADRQIAELNRSRPAWATTRILTAQADLITHPSASSLGVSAYVASYRAAPFLMHEARWRIAYGASVWNRLPDATRQGLLDEAEWLTRFDNSQRPAIEHLLGARPAAMAYQFRMASGHLPSAD